MVVPALLTVALVFPARADFEAGRAAVAERLKAMPAPAQTADPGVLPPAARDPSPQPGKEIAKPSPLPPLPNPSNSNFRSKSRTVRCRESEFDVLPDPDKVNAFACVKRHFGTFWPNCRDDWKAVQADGKDYCLHPEAQRHEPQCPGRTAFQQGKRIIDAGRDTCDRKYSTENYPRCRLRGTAVAVDHQGTEDLCLPVRRELECDHHGAVRVNQQTSMEILVDHLRKRDKCVRRGYQFRPPVLR